MRRILHILPPSFSPIAHRATLSFRVADCRTKYKKIAIDDQKKEEIKAIIVELVKESPFYINMEHYNRLFNTIGEVRASIFSNGRAIGIWSIDKVKKKIEWETFEKTNRKTKSQIKKKISEMRKFLFEQC